jgi:hypothetical protein
MIETGPYFDCDSHIVEPLENIQAMDLDTRGVALSRTTMDVAERRAAMADRRPPAYKH